MQKVSRNFYLLLIISLFFVYSCKDKNILYLSVSFEKFDESFVYTDNKPEMKFSHTNRLSMQKIHSGKFSYILDSIKQFSFTINLKLKARTNYIFSFWRYANNDNVFIVLTCGKNYYKASKFVIERDTNNWEKVYFSIIIPDSLDNKDFEFYIWNNSNSTVYIDDVEIKSKKIDDIVDLLKNLQNNNDTNILILSVSEKDFNELYDQRNKALDQQVLTSDLQQWVNAALLYKDTLINIRLRLKGDWTDHLDGFTWSFRIDVKDNIYFKGMKRFSLQRSDMRYNLYQWLLYNTARKEGILAPRYGYVKVFINNLYLGVYAYEEHFQKQLIEAQHHREAPIMKIDEETFWNIVTLFNRSRIWYNNPYYNAAKINSFSEKKYIKDFKNDFLIAQNLLYQHKYQLANPDEVINTDLFAKYYALINLFKGFHGMAWHNQRFYYNPITSKLEPIIFDNYGIEGRVHIRDSIILGDFIIDNIYHTERLNRYLFFDSLFTDKYISYLQKFSSKRYLDSLLNVLKTDLISFEQMIQSNNKNYKFDVSMIYQQAKEIQLYLPKYKTNAKKLYGKKFVSMSHIIKDISVDTLLVKNYVYAYTQKELGGRKYIKLINYYPKDLYLVAYRTSGSVVEKEKLLVPSYISTNDNFLLTEVGLKAKSLIVSDNKYLFEVELLPWPEPTAWSPRQELEKNNKFPNEPYYKVEGQKVTFSGKQKISSIIYIPPGYNVFFEPGTEIDFLNNAGFISWSSVFMNGTEQKPIIVKSSDRTAIGFTVLQAPDVEMSYVVFDGLDRWKYKGWELTGAVNIYESNVKINNSNFINNLCEDALNIVRSTFDVSNCYFANTYGDAFDSDFCTGIVENCVFEKTKNDAIDFSGSVININNCKMNNIGDKAISGGENSHLIVKECNIQQSVIGVASKDNSLIEIQGSNIKNCSYGFVILQKKPEYGPAKIIAKNVNLKRNIKDWLIERKSTLILDGQKIDGFERYLKEKFY